MRKSTIILVAVVVVVIALILANRGAAVQPEQSSAPSTLKVETGGFLDDPRNYNPQQTADADIYRKVESGELKITQ